MSEIRAVLRLDDCTPTACDVQHSSGDGSPFVYVQINPQLEVWARDPESMRRLAAAAITAAEALETAIDGPPPVQPAVQEVA